MLLAAVALQGLGWMGSSGVHRTWVCNHKAAVSFHSVKGQTSVACSYTIIRIFTLQLSLPPALGRILGKLRWRGTGKPRCRPWGREESDAAEQQLG